MRNYRIIVNYEIRSGLEEKAIHFIETEVYKMAKDCGCHDLELWLDEDSSLHLIGTGLWDSLKAIERFDDLLLSKRELFLKYFTDIPSRQSFKILKKEIKNTRKAA